MFKKSKETLHKTHETLCTSDSPWSSFFPNPEMVTDPHLFSTSSKKRLDKLHQLYQQLVYSDKRLHLKTHRQLFKTNISECFLGSTLLDWFQHFENDIAQQDAFTLCQFLVKLGFIVSVDGLLEFNLSSYFIFQHPKLLPSHEWIPHDVDYIKYSMRKSRKISSKDVLTPIQESILSESKDKLGSEWNDLQELVDQQCHFLRNLSKEESKIWRLQEDVFWNVMKPSNNDSLLMNSSLYNLLIPKWILV